MSYHPPSSHALLPLSVPPSGSAAHSSSDIRYSSEKNDLDQAAPLFAPAKLPQPSPTRTLSLLLATSCITLFFTVVPVFATLPSINGVYYSWNDVLRFLEPILALPIYFTLLHSSRVLSTTTPAGLHAGIAFLIAASIYAQGAAFHSAATMFKHPFKAYMDAHPDLVASDPFFTAFYVWLRTVWEHAVGHYLYATGGILMSAILAWSFRDQTAQPGRWRPATRALWTVSVLAYGLIIGAVAIEFPRGSIVALLLCIVWLGGVGTYLVRSEGKRGWYVLGSRYVLQYYVASYAVALVIVLGWVAHVKGFGNREDAGVQL
ncbi:hypothetical protein HDU87_001808 [Geranomyces variabilis]|uniref:Uncharacterized protein n=1 Tax=Geranomyces variabilis TaxID=109894 RepID=A0AAD5XTP7_9FUNG|nr:hypothetical protein HDU87_001808 [Geranomyces variabilis]